MMLSTVSLVLFLGIAFLLGFLLKHLIGKSTGTNYKSQFESLEKEHATATKDLGRARKSLDNSHKERDSWKTKYEEANSKITSGQNAGKAEIKTLKENILASQKETATVNAEKERANTRFDRLKNEFESYKRKMQVEKEAIKGYKTELETLRKEEKSLSEQVEKLTKQNGDMKGSLEKQFQKNSEINDISSQNRRLRAKNIKIQTDLEYWEKKHFETHHELAKLKKSLEQA